MTTYRCSVYEEDDYLVIAFDLTLYQQMKNPTYLVPIKKTDKKFMCRWKRPKEPFSLDESGFPFEYIVGKPTIFIHSSRQNAQWFINKGLPAIYQGEVSLPFLLKLWKVD